MNFGKFINTTPLHCEWLRQESWGFFWKVDIWEYFANLEAPMYCVCEKDWKIDYNITVPSGTVMQPDRHFITDFGSIPPPCMALPSFSRTRFIHAYLMHDSGYKHGGLWVLVPSATGYVFMVFTKAQMDTLLWYWLDAEDANWYQRSTIYRMVRLATPWIKYPQERKQKSVT